MFRHTQRLFNLYGWVAILVLALAGCAAPAAAPGSVGSDSTSTTTADATTETVTASDGSTADHANTVIVGSWQEGIFYNVLYTQGGGSLSVAKQAQRGLLFLDEDSNWTGELAAELPTIANGGISEDGLTITFNLREGITWHDGTPVTSADVLATWEMIMNPDNAVITRFGYDKIAAIDTPDDLTVVVQFSEPFASWPILFDAIMAKHIIDANSPGLDDSEAVRVPMGFGPFKMVEWRTGEYVEFEAFDDYWQGRPVIDRLIIRNYPNVDALLQALEAGEVDIAWSMPLSYIPRIQDLADRGVALVTSPGAGSERYHMNPEFPLFADRSLRLALHHAIDKQTIIDSLLYGVTNDADSEWQGSPYEHTELPEYAYDVATCQELLESSGWTVGDDGIREKDGERLTFTHATTVGDLQRENIQLLVQQMFRECGLEMTIENGRSADLFGNWSQNGRWTHGTYQMGGWSHGLRVPDPEISNRFLCSEIASDSNPAGSQWFRYCNPAVDELLEAQAVEFDVDARRELILQAQEIIHEDAYTIHLFQTVTVFGVSDSLENFVLHPFANYYWNSHEWAWAE